MVPLTDKQEATLRRLWARTDLAALGRELGLSPRQVQRAARQLGLVAPRPRLDWLPLAACLLAAMVLGANNLRGEFVYDDMPAIVDNPATHGLGQVVRIFTTPSWWPVDSGAPARHYRPLTTFSYALNHSLHGLRPEGYHLVNNLLHGLAGWVLFVVCRGLGLGRFGSAVAAGLFLAHPVHVEAVAWCNGRAELMAGLFILAALACHQRARANADAAGWHVGAVACFVAAGLSKETGYLTPFVLLAYDGIVLGRGGGLGRDSWRCYLAHAAVLAVFYILRVVTVGGATEALVTPMASPLGEAGVLTRLLTGSYVIARYLGLLVWPATLSVDYSPDAITAVTSPADPRAVLGLAVLVGYLAGAAILAMRRPPVGFVLVATALVFAPASNVLFPIGTIMAERLMFVPLLAWVVPLAWLLDQLAGAGRPGLAGALAVLLLAGYGARTVQRNRDWTDELALFTAAHQASPDSAMANKNLAGALHNRGRNEEALPLLDRAIAILPEFPDAHYVRGNALYVLGRYPEALESFEAALALTPNHVSALLNRGATLHQLGRYEEAFACFDQVAKLDGTRSAAWFNAVHSLLAAGRTADAAAALADGLRRFPDDAAAADAQAAVAAGRAGEAAADEP